ncbi:ESX secretion-associated protein EspG [Nocardia sp. NPDC050793]|uniref:ESX secretion-associated protein EspG n=1 Tax=Nocardia sp. NPDC050793 TaxID=3155159 RepID=UPI0033DAC528
MVDLNVDAALFLQNMVGIDAYPPVLALMPNVFDANDLEQVRAIIAQDLRTAGVIENDRVHPAIEHWLQCLYRPDVELAARIVDLGPGEVPSAVLRMSLIRHEDTHVLAVRCDDHVIIQSVFHSGRQLNTLTAALIAGMGSGPAPQFEPITATLEQFTAVPSDQAERRRALLELGAHPHTAGVLSRVLDEVVRRAEVVMVEHHDGGSVQTEVCLSVLDTPQGRIVVTPRVAMDGEVWSTYAPGDDAAVQAGIAALVELLPGRSWFDTTRES